MLVTDWLCFQCADPSQIHAPFIFLFLLYEALLYRNCTPHISWGGARRQSVPGAALPLGCGPRWEGFCCGPGVTLRLGSAFCHHKEMKDKKSLTFPRIFDRVCTVLRILKHGGWQRERDRSRKMLHGDGELITVGAQACAMHGLFHSAELTGSSTGLCRKCLGNGLWGCVSSFPGQFLPKFLFCLVCFSSCAETKRCPRLRRKWPHTPAGIRLTRDPAGRLTNRH